MFLKFQNSKIYIIKKHLKIAESSIISNHKSIKQKPGFFNLSPNLVKLEQKNVKNPLSKIIWFHRLYIYIYIYTPGQKYKTTRKNKEKDIFTIFRLWKSDIWKISIRDI